MSRRRFLLAAATAGTLTALPTSRIARAATPSVSSWKRQFHAALSERPWLAGYRSTSASSFSASATLAGKLPEGLRGTLFRNGPAQHELGDFRWQHWFDGDGMLQAFRLSDSGVRHQARMIETPKYLAEQLAGHPLYSTFGTAIDDPAPIAGPDTVNAANISVLSHHGKLFALWEAGSAVAMNADTLATEGVHRFSPATESVPFSAHPRVEADGTLWNFGYASAQSALVLWHIDAGGAVKRTGVIPVQPMSMPHDFMVTARHLVIMIPPFVFDPDRQQRRSFLGSHHWRPEQPTRVLVVDKNDFSKHRVYELPAQWVFHFGNAWEDNAGVIRFDGARASSPQLMTEYFREVMRGVDAPAPPSIHYLYRIDTKRGAISESPMLGVSADVESEFPTIDSRVCAQRYEQLILMTKSASHPTPHGHLNTVSRYRLDRQQLDSYIYPDSHLPEEHLFVAKSGSQPEADGWVIGSAYDYTTDRTELNVFEANHLADGPLCTATLPYAVPLAVHGKFVG